MDLINYVRSIIFYYCINGNIPSTIGEIAVYCYKKFNDNNELTESEIRTIYSTLQTFCERDILIREDVLRLAEKKYITKIPKKITYMYFLSERGVELARLLFPESCEKLINLQEFTIAYVPFDEVYTKVASYLKGFNKKTPSKKRILKLFNPFNIAHFRNYYFVKVLVPVKDFTSHLPKYPEVTLEEIITIVLKNKVNRDLERELRKLFINRKAKKSKEYINISLLWNNFNKICERIRLNVERLKAKKERRKLILQMIEEKFGYKGKEAEKMLPFFERALSKKNNDSVKQKT